MGIGIGKKQTSTISVVKDLLTTEESNKSWDYLNGNAKIVNGRLVRMLQFLFVPFQNMGKGRVKTLISVMVINVNYGNSGDLNNDMP